MKAKINMASFKQFVKSTLLITHKITKSKDDKSETIFFLRSCVSDDEDIMPWKQNERVVRPLISLSCNFIRL